VVLDMTTTFLVQARTGLSPEWDRDFDEEFAKLISSDPDLVQAEFDALVGACWNQSPAAPPPPTPAAGPAPPPPPGGTEAAGSRSAEAVPDQPQDQQRSPP
jgi:hypothetical protein